MKKIVLMLTLFFMIWLPSLAEAFQNTEALDALSTSRNHPAKVGDTVYLEGIQGDIGSRTEITFSELYTGEEAKALAMKESSLNREPAEGTEYIIARFDVSFFSKENNDSLMLFANHFGIVTQKGNVIDRNINNLVFGFITDGQIYSGAEMTLDVPILVSATEEGLLLNYWDAWFSLNSDITEAGESTTGQQSSIQLTLPPDTMDKLQHNAVLQEITIDEYVSDIIAEYMDQI
jgi:hypothetical protein